MKLRYAVLPLCLAFALPSMAQNRGFNVRDMVALDRVSAPLLTPDAGYMVYSVRQMNKDVTKPSNLLWLQDAKNPANKPQLLTSAEWNANSPEISADGKTIYFLSSKSGSQQLYKMDLMGKSAPVQLTNFVVDIGTYHLSPDNKKIAFSSEVFSDCHSDLHCTQKRMAEKEKQPATGMVFDRLFVRHWDTWADGRQNHIFVADLSQNGQMVSTAKAISTVLDGDIPSKPFGGSDEYTWSPDGKSIVGSIRIAGKTEAWSTNFDLYQFDTDGNSQPRNLTSSNPAWDTHPVFSADGKTLYYRAMKRPGFEADRFGIMAMDIHSQQSKEIAANWDRSADGITLSADGKSIYTTAQDRGELPIFKIDLTTEKVTPVVGGGSIAGFAIAKDTLVFARNTLQTGNQIFVSNLQGKNEKPVTASTAERLPDVKLGEFEQFSFKGANNDTVYGYVVKPWNYQEGKTYPVAFLIHGGPQGSFGNSFGYRWNPQTYSGEGYAVVMIDFHGSTGYGQAFTDAISQDWGGKPLEDLQKGWAAAQQKYRFLDGNNACALGASYGGFMVNWIAGNWNQPWKCLVNHDGVFDTKSMGFVTEELWFSEWENGGTPYDVPKNYERFNPSNYVSQWRVPMLVVQGGRDYRVPEDQGLSAFTALQRRGIESKFLYFPDENHWVLKAQNSILWHDTVNDWLRQHIGQHQK